MKSSQRFTVQKNHILYLSALVSLSSSYLVTTDLTLIWRYCYLTCVRVILLCKFSMRRILKYQNGGMEGLQVA